MSNPVQIHDWGIASALDAFVPPAPYAAKKLIDDAVEHERRMLVGPFSLFSIPQKELPEGFVASYVVRPMPSLTPHVPFSGIRTRLKARDDEQKKRLQEQQQEAARQARLSRQATSIFKRGIQESERLMQKAQHLKKNLAAARVAGTEAAAHEPMGGFSAQGIHADALQQAVGQPLDGNGSSDAGNAPPSGMDDLIRRSLRHALGELLEDDLQEPDVVHEQPQQHGQRDGSQEKPFHVQDEKLMAGMKGASDTSPAQPQDGSEAAAAGPKKDAAHGNSRGDALDWLINQRDNPQPGDAGYLMSVMKRALSQQWQGVNQAESRKLLEVANDIYRHGWQKKHEQMLEELIFRRADLKKMTGRLKEELPEDDLRLLNILEAARAGAKAEADYRNSAAAGRQLRVNELPDSAYEEPAHSTPENGFPSYQSQLEKEGISQTQPDGQRLAALMFLRDKDPGGGGQCRSCGMSVPSHLDECEDIFTGDKLQLCPICNCVEHLDWAGFQGAGRMIWAPAVPQAFLSQLCVLSVMAADVLRLDAEKQTLENDLFPEEEAEEDMSDNDYEMLRNLRPLHLDRLRSANVSEDDAPQVLEMFYRRYKQLRRFFAPPPGNSFRLNDFAERIQLFYSELSNMTLPLVSYFGGRDDSGVNVTSPLFYAEMLRGEGFFEGHVRELRSRHAQVMEKRKSAAPLDDDDRNAMREISEMYRAIEGLGGLRFLPDPVWWAPLVKGPWSASLMRTHGPQRWAHFFPEETVVFARKNRRRPRI